MRSSAPAVPPTFQISRASRASTQSKSTSRCPAFSSRASAARTAASIEGSQASQKCPPGTPIVKLFPPAALPIAPAPSPNIRRSSSIAASSASSTERARSPGVSKLRDSGTIPSVDQRPIVGL